MKALDHFFMHINRVWLQVDKGISPEVVRSVLAERANLHCLAAKSAYQVIVFPFIH